jgi:SH3-like domain-containing protein
MKSRSTLIFIIGLLIITSLACSQAGEIISPEEATARAQNIPDIDSEAGGGGTSSLGVQPGDEITLTGRGFIVNMLDQPGGRISGSPARDSQATLLDIVDFEDETWYKINANGSEGWVKEENIAPVETAEEDGADGADSEETVFEGPQINDEVYLAGTGFLINILEEPRIGGRIISGDSRGTPAVITEIRDVDGGIWYKIDSRAGAGWVPAENISADAP